MSCPSHFSTAFHRQLSGLSVVPRKLPVYALSQKNTWVVSLSLDRRCRANAVSYKHGRSTGSSRVSRDRQRAWVGPFPCAPGSKNTGHHSTASVKSLSESIPYLRDVGCCVGAAVGARIWTKLFDVAVQKELIDQKLSRKLVHITTGPIFVLTWPLFSSLPWARCFAAIVPSLNAVRLIAVGTGAVEDEGLVLSVSRSGDRSELLKGPLYYCLVLIAATLLSWRENPAGVVAISLMCGGDGMADIVGRRWGKEYRLPYNKGKSWAGSVAMFVSGSAVSLGLLTCLGLLSHSNLDGLAGVVPVVVLVSALCTVIESLPINQVLDDNLSVPTIAFLSAAILMPLAPS